MGQSGPKMGGFWTQSFNLWSDPVRFFGKKAIGDLNMKN